MPVETACLYLPQRPYPPALSMASLLLNPFPLATKAAALLCVLLLIIASDLPTAGELAASYLLPWHVYYRLPRHAPPAHHVMSARRLRCLFMLPDAEGRQDRALLPCLTCGGGGGTPSSACTSNKDCSASQICSLHKCVAKPHPSPPPHSPPPSPSPPPPSPPPPAPPHCGRLLCRQLLVSNRAGVGGA